MKNVSGEMNVGVEVRDAGLVGVLGEDNCFLEGIKKEVWRRCFCLGCDQNPVSCLEYLKCQLSHLSLEFNTWSQNGWSWQGLKSRMGWGIWDGEVGLGWGTGNGGKMGKVKFPIF